ncbi:MAG: hypothetical protein WC352_06490 [Candidatus Omnitrophota bacterium]|jgi:hypothetical protein
MDEQEPTIKAIRRQLHLLADLMSEIEKQQTALVPDWETCRDKAAAVSANLAKLKKSRSDYSFCRDTLSCS